MRSSQIKKLCLAAVLCAVAVVGSLIRNLLGLGTLMAFPGSMFGVLLCGIAWQKSRNITLTVAASGTIKRAGILEKAISEVSSC